MWCPSHQFGRGGSQKGSSSLALGIPFLFKKVGVFFDSSLNPGFDVTTCAGRYKRKEGDLENASCLSQGLVRLL